MAYEPPVAVYDACVLYPFHLRNLLVQCAAERLIAARWSEAIHEEWMWNLAAKNPTLPPDALTRTRGRRWLMGGLHRQLAVAAQEFIAAASASGG